MKQKNDNRLHSAKIYIIVFTSVTVLFINCLRLDPFLFGGEEESAYLLDNYTGKTECKDAIDSVGPLSVKPKQIELSSGNEHIAALLIAPKVTYAPTDTIILYFHGKAANIDYYWPRARLLGATGYPVMAIDYRGYGMSSGKSTEESLYEDGTAALKYIHDSLGNPHVIVYAFSLGTLVGGRMVYDNTYNNIIKFVLEAPIGSVETLVQDETYLNFPGAYVTSFKGSNAERMKSIVLPYLWLHGTSDETLDYTTNGLAVWKNYHGQEGYHCRVEGGGHANLPTRIGYNRYIKMLKDFFTGHASENTLLTKK